MIEETIVGIYTISIHKQDRLFIADIDSSDGNSFSTWGRSEEELWDMIGDACLTEREIEVGWWNKLLWKLRRYNRNAG